MPTARQGVMATAKRLLARANYRRRYRSNNVYPVKPQNPARVGAALPASHCSPGGVCETGQELPSV